MRLIDADAVEKQAYDDVHYHAELEDWEFDVVTHYLDHAPTIDAVPVTEAELKHLLNDTITYIWRLEDRGCDKPEFGYDSRKALLEKLKQFYNEHFMRNGCYRGEQKDGDENG